MRKDKYYIALTGADAQKNRGEVIRNHYIDKDGNFLHVKC